MINSVAIKIVIALLLFLVGGFGGYFVGSNYEHTALVEALDIIHPIRDHNSSYSFINPLLAYVIPSSEQSAQVNLKKKISGFIAEQKKSGAVSDASVFFYDLNRGKWIGVNEAKKYNPASMLKVVIMVAYLKDAQKSETLLQKRLTYTADIDNFIKEDAFNSLSNLQIGKSYSVEELINKMIIDSDNGAQFLLLDHVNKNSLDYIYNALNISNPANSPDDFTISPRIYSLFFRILYSATYLNEEMSEKALSILSQTTFMDGLMSDLPKQIPVAHKFGEHVLAENGRIKSIELHDCGIIYVTDYPYFLCVMTEGKNLDILKGVIKTISSMVYKEYVKE